MLQDPRDENLTIHLVVSKRVERVERYSTRRLFNVPYYISRPRQHLATTKIAKRDEGKRIMYYVRHTHLTETDTNKNR
jgi:hypothetical protein